MSEPPIWERQNVSNRGDARRAALLVALEGLLLEGNTLDAIAISDVTKRAGVTRSAFYFYFANIATAVTALGEGLIEDSRVANEILADTSIAPEPRIRQALTGIFDDVEKQKHIFRALLAARAMDTTLREVWDHGRADFAAPIAKLITSERKAKRAPAGADAEALALTLLELNDRSLELFVLGVGPTLKKTIDALVSIWLRSIYATDPH